MRTRATFVIALACFISGNAHAGEDDLVRQAFNSYKEAVLAGKGAAAADVLTAGSLDYFAQMRDLALYATEQELKAGSITDLMQALTFRHRIPVDQLQTLSGRDLVILALERGWIGKASVARADIGDVSVNAGSATAVVLKQGRPTSASFRFSKEKESWKLDLIAMLRMAESALQTGAKAQGASTDQFVLSMLEMVSGKPVGPDIWKPPLTRQHE
jgi:hypothetical protein